MSTSFSEGQKELNLRIRRRWSNCGDGNGESVTEVGESGGIKEEGMVGDSLILVKYHSGRVLWRCSGLLPHFRPLVLPVESAEKVDAGTLLPAHSHRQDLATKPTPPTTTQSNSQLTPLCLQRSDQSTRLWLSKRVHQRPTGTVLLGVVLPGTIRTVLVPVLELVNSSI